MVEMLVIMTSDMISTTIMVNSTKMALLATATAATTVTDMVAGHYATALELGAVQFRG